MTNLTRRTILRLLAAGTSTLGLRSATATAADKDDNTTTVDNWRKTHNRVWLGGRFWANPMEDWRIVDGAAECQTMGPDRNIQLLTHQITNVAGSFAMAVRVEQVEVRKTDTGAGFRVGIRSELNEHRSNAFAKNGYRAGVQDGSLILARQTKKADFGGAKAVIIALSGEPTGDDAYKLTLTVTSEDGKTTFGTLTQSLPATAVLGNVASQQLRPRRQTRYTEQAGPRRSLSLERLDGFG